MRPASSRAADFRPRAMSTRIATSHTPTTAATVMSRPRSISGRLRRAGRRRSRSAAREYPGARGRRSIAELRDVGPICKLLGWPQTFAETGTRGAD